MFENKVAIGIEVDLRMVMVLWNCLFGSTLLANERFVNVRNDTTPSDGGFNQAVELLISTNGELKMARCDTFDF
jgi:hypothetical protein